MLSTGQIIRPNYPVNRFDYPVNQSDQTKPVETNRLDRIRRFNRDQLNPSLVYPLVFNSVTITDLIVKKHIHQILCFQQKWGHFTNHFTFPYPWQPGWECLIFNPLNKN